jgi:dTDP-4-amino-4,6-dideoxygalactose transaminase
MVPLQSSETYLPLSAPILSGSERQYLDEVLASTQWAGGGPFTQRCERRLEADLGIARALLTPSCTAALEMCALLADLAEGDEVIMPSFTFPSTANAVTLRGATPVFVDIAPDTLNIDPKQIELAITPRTKAILIVDYAGVPCEIDVILGIAQRHSLAVIEDAAQAYLSEYRGRPAGSLADMAAFSFHETKNFGCGEGGAFVTSSSALSSRADIIRDKGTNRSAFRRGEVDKYTWVGVGSSYLPSEFQAAVLLAQLENARVITAHRLAMWNRYQSALRPIARRYGLRQPAVPNHVTHNAQIYWLIVPDIGCRDELLAFLQHAGIGAAFHYVPLHLSKEGRRAGRAADELVQTIAAADRLLRLPLHGRINAADVDRVVERVEDFFATR